MENQILHLHPLDNIGIAKVHLEPGMEVAVIDAAQQEIQLKVKDFIAPGHKVALSTLEKGQVVRRYGEVIGQAFKKIDPGMHVHTHNLQMAHSEEQQGLDLQNQSLNPITAEEQPTFLGYPRPNGKVGTRNYIAVIANVNCSAFVCQQIAAYFTADILSQYPNIDGVIALTHAGGCSSPDRSHLQRTMAGMAKHPNIGGYITVSLGCEGNQPRDLARDFGLPDPALPLHPGEPAAIVIQALGGSQATIEAGISAVNGLLPKVNAAVRVPQPLSKLTLAMECGGSDSWSGITANPLVGRVADRIIHYGGTVVISETPETFGAQHILAKRAISAEVKSSFLAKIDWWKNYLTCMGGDFDDNPAPGNREGGLTNICEKSLGAITKGGSTPLMAVYDYAAPIQSSGFVFMDSPGYDPASVTGMVAGGSNLILFTTGRGSVAGYKPAPVIKISTNSATYRRMTGDMDFNAGQILDGSADFPTCTEELLTMIIEVASGQPTKSEAFGMGQAEFVPWEPFGFV